MAVDPEIKRAQARERLRRFRERNPDYRKEESLRTKAAQREIRRLHPTVFERLVREGRARGWGRHRARDNAFSTLARMHPKQWKRIREGLK